MILTALILWVNAAGFLVGLAAPSQAVSDGPLLRGRSASVPALQNGDIVLQASQSGMAESIRKATNSPYSHVGLIEVTKDGVFVIEAISPVTRTPFAKWKRRGQGGHLTVMRPRLDRDELQAVVDAARRELGKPYDVRYGWDDERIYCSELVVKAFERGAHITYGEKVKLESLKLGTFEKALAAKLGVPLTQEVVPPGSLAADPKLQIVFSDVPPSLQ